MESNKPKEANPVEPATDTAAEAGPSRRELLVKGGKIAAGVGRSPARQPGQLGPLLRGG